jgi:hypothetical protein
MVPTTNGRAPEVLLCSQTLAPNRPAAYKAKLARLLSPSSYKGRIEYGLGLGVVVKGKLKGRISLTYTSLWTTKFQPFYLQDYAVLPESQF